MSKETIPYDLARRIILPFGKYKGQTLDMISSQVDGSPDAEGLKYLDWLVEGYPWFKMKFPVVHANLVAFLADSTVASDLDEVLA